MNNATHMPWKLWNGYGPGTDGLMRVERIGPDGPYLGLTTHPDSSDIAGTMEDLEMVVLAVNSHQAMLDALRALRRAYRHSRTQIFGTDAVEDQAIAAIALGEENAS